MLSDKHIKEAISTGRIKISPEIDYNTQLGACSVDLKLGATFRVFEYSRIPYVDLREYTSPSEYTQKIVLEPNQPIIIQSKGFILASTEEWIELSDDLAGRLEGRSSLARLGIIVHSTAGLIDPGWAGKIVMELGNVGVMPVALYPGMRICALTFEQVSSNVEVPYRSKPQNMYAGQKEP